VTEALVRAGAVFANLSSVPTDARRKAVYSALNYGCEKTVEAMLDCGAAPNEDLNTRGQTLGHMAAENGNNRMLEAFVRAGGDLELIDANERTPLRAAIRNHHWTSARVLLTRLGAHVNAKELLGFHLSSDVRRLVEDYKALTEACDTGSSAVLAVLASRASFAPAAALPEDGSSPLLRLPLDTRNEDGDSLLDRAAAAGRPDVVEALLTRWPTGAAAEEEAQRARLEAARVSAAKRVRSEELARLFAGKSTRDAVVASDAAAAVGTRGF